MVATMLRPAMEVRMAVMAVRTVRPVLAADIPPAVDTPAEADTLPAVGIQEAAATAVVAIAKQH
jgi:hypothetical protein